MRAKCLDGNTRRQARQNFKLFRAHPAIQRICRESIGHQREERFLRRWKMAGEAERLNALRLDVRELTERTDNSIKFLSDMFYARAYRVAANRVGVPDYRYLVEEKLKIAGELYEFMVNEFHQAHAFTLEAMVVAILVIELIHLFAWR